MQSTSKDNGGIYRKLIVNKLTRLKNALTKKPFASWSQEEFLASIEEINRLAGELSSSQSQLLFCIVPGSYRTLYPENEPIVSISSPTDQSSQDNETEIRIPRRDLSWDENWRSTLRISAFKVSKSSSVIESEKVIDLNTYGKALNLMIQFDAQLVKNTDPSNSADDQESAAIDGGNEDEESQGSENFVLLFPQRHNIPEHDCSSNMPSTSSGSCLPQRDDIELSGAETSCRNWPPGRDQMTATVWFSNLSTASQGETGYPGDLGFNTVQSWFEDSCNQEKTSHFEDVDLGTSTSSTSALCSICMDKKANMILPCTHMYCSECIEEWEESDNENHDRCPTCRNRMSSKDNWLLPDKPSQLDLNEYLVSLITE